jgi:hypothetical protein
MSKKSPNDNPTIAENRKARHDYFIEETYEAGLSLQGWEVKSLRAGRVQLKEAYVFVKDAEAFLFGAHVSLDARHPRPHPHSQAPAEPLRAEPLGRRGGAPRLHARAAGDVLEERPRQAAHRPGEGQEGARQARQRKGSRLAAGEVPLDETLDEMKKAAASRL